MLQILLVPSNKIVASLLASQRDAQSEAVKHVKEYLKTTPHGRRMLAWCAGNVTWKIASAYVVIQEMVGVWIDTGHGRIVPEDIEDDETLLFMTKGGVKLGTYVGGVFVDRDTEKQYDPDEVIAFLHIPEN